VGCSMRISGIYCNIRESDCPRKCDQRLFLEPTDALYWSCQGVNRGIHDVERDGLTHFDFEKSSLMAVRLVWENLWWKKN